MKTIDALNNMKTFAFVRVATDSTDYGYNSTYAGVAVLGDRIPKEELEAQLEFEGIFNMVHVERDLSVRPTNERTVRGNNLVCVFNLNETAPNFTSYKTKELVVVAYDKATNKLELVSREDCEDQELVVKRLTKVVEEKRKEREKSIEKALEVMDIEDKRRLARALFEKK